MENIDKKLSRTGDQLLQLEKTINRVLGDNGAALKEGIRLLHLQTGLKTSGPHARLLLTLHTAWIGSTQSQSAAGLIGKGMNTICDGVTALTTAAIGRYNPGIKELVKTLISLMGIGAIYLSTVTLGQWNEKFKGYNPLYLKSSGTLFKDLAIVFITASGLWDGISILLMEAANLPKEGQKELLNVSRVYFLLVMLYASESDKESKTAEMWEVLLPFLKESLPSIEKLTMATINKSMSGEMLIGPLKSSLQVMKGALEEEDTQTLKHAIEDMLMLFGVSREGLLEEFRLVSEKCQVMAQNLSLASRETAQTVTQIIQST
jgi:hypothetical protein